MGRVEKKLGSRVATHRKLAGLTQAQLAERVGVTVETISRLERGSTIPSLSRIESIARAVRVDLHELFRFRERASSKEQAVDYLTALVGRRTADDVKLVTELATKIFERYTR